jgi:hypothetical protein
MDSANATLRFLHRGGLRDATFDQFADRVVRAARLQQIRLGQEFAQGQLAAVRGALVQGLRTQVSPSKQAQMVRDSLGLGNYHRQALENYTAALREGQAPTNALRDRRFDRTARRGALTETQVASLSERYRGRLISFRAGALAETEARRAVHAGAREAIQQAIDDRLLSADEVKQTWNTKGDAKVRDTHASMQGQTRMFREVFESGGGAILAYPGDPTASASETVNCRCHLEMELVKAPVFSRNV